MANKKILRAIVGSKKRRLGAAFVVLLVIIAGTGLYKYHQSQLPGNRPPVHIATEQQATTNEIKKLQASPPSKDNPAKQADYYRRLRSDLANSGDYKAAIAAFTHQEAANPNSLTYQDYITLAYYNHEVGNKTAMNAALDKALAIMPKQDDLNENYIYSDAVQNINSIRADYNK